MARGRRKVARQEPQFVTAEQLPRSQGHPFYKALNALLAEAGFNCWIEGRCQPYYEQVETRGHRSTALECLPQFWRNSRIRLHQSLSGRAANAAMGNGDLLNGGGATSKSSVNAACPLLARQVDRGGLG